MVSTLGLVDELLSDHGRSRGFAARVLGVLAFSQRSSCCLAVSIVRCIGVVPRVRALFHSCPQLVRRRRAFSLIEVVITLVIIGVVAIIAVPRVSSAAGNARFSAMEASARVMRQALDYYSIEHEGRSPSHDADWSVNTNEKFFMLRLCRRSDSVGEPGDSLGPYLRDIPVNPFNGLNTVRVADGSGTPGINTHGWWYAAGRDVFLPDDSVASAKYILERVYGMSGAGAEPADPDAAPASLGDGFLDLIASPSGRTGLGGGTIK